MAASGAERKAAWRLLHDTPYYARHALKLVNERGEMVPFVYRKAQLKVDRALEAQRRAGRPMRIRVLKSRRVGVSTSAQAKVFQTATTRSNRRGLVVAHDTDTAGELFDISDVFYSHLPGPPDYDDSLKPGLVSRRASPGGMKQLVFGETSRAKRARGELGLNSSLKIDTAKEVQAGRGKTITDLHLTEVAFWPDPRKALSLLNAVFDSPDTLVVIESTANGHNAFKAGWDRAERGDGGYAAVFIGWTEDDNCWREFDDEDHRARFVESIGKGEFGEDEPYLIAKFGCTPEQLLWRRTTIVDKCDGSLAMFRQEYPSTPLEAFVGSGKHVFSMRLIEQAEDDARGFDPPQPDPEVADVAQPGDGLFVAKAFRQRTLAMGTQEVPTGTLWYPAGPAQAESRKALWRVWEHPDVGGEDRDEAGRRVVRQPRPYVIFADVASGEDQTSSEDPDYHAIQVIDHLSREQVAQWHSRCDRDELAVELLLAGLYYNDALLAVEITGGYGLSVVEALWKRFGYRNLYRRQRQGSIKSDRPQPLLGWDTNRNTKPAMEDEAAQLLREGTSGIRSLALVSEMKTYVRFENGQRGADDDAFDDLLMAWMGAQRVAQLKTPRSAHPEKRKHYNSMPRATGRF